MIFKTIEDEAALAGQKITSIFAGTKAKIEAIFQKDSGLNMSTFKDGMSTTEALDTTMREASNGAIEFANGLKLEKMSLEEASAAVDNHILKLRMQEVATLAQKKNLGSIRLMLNTYNGGLETVGLTQEQFIQSVSKSNPILGKYLANVGAGEATMGGYVGTLISAKAVTIGLRIATTALNAVIGMGIGLIVSLLMSGIQKFIERVKESMRDVTEKIKDTNQELQSLASTTKQISDDFRNLKSSADEVIPRFTELAKGVDKFGRNVSLTDEEYEEFVKLQNKIAEMFPELNLGMDESGNAMLSLSYAADTLSNSLWDLVKAERAVANEELAKQMPDQIDKIKEQIDNYEEAIDGFEEKVGYYNMAMDWYKPGNDTANTNAAELLRQIFDPSVWNQLLNKYTKEIKYENGFTETVVDWDALFGSEEVQRTLSGIENQIVAYRGRIEGIWQSLTPILTAWLQTDQTFAGFDEISQRIAMALVNGLDINWLVTNGYDTADSMKLYITENILNPIATASPEVQNAFTDLLDLSNAVRSGEISSEQFAEKITGVFTNLFSTLDEDGKAMLISWLNALGIAGTSVETIIRHIIEEFGKSPQGDSGGGSNDALDLSELADKLKKIQDAYALIATAEKEMEDGGLSADTIKALADETDNYLDYLYEENGLIKLNTDAWREYILTKLSDNIQGLQETRKALISERDELLANKAAIDERLQTEWGNQAVYDQLKETNDALALNTQRLAENGIQLGIYTNQYNQALNAVDAYSEALGNFPSIKDYIENVSSAFETLANLQSTVADGFTMSLEKALEFAAVYPEILDSAQVAADGQITLNSGVVNSFIDGKEAELRAGIEAEISKLEADKGVLNAKLAMAQAELDIAQNVGEGEGQITQELAEYKVNAGNAVAEALIAAGIDEAAAYQLAAAAMAEDFTEFDRIAMEVATDVDGNLNKAAYEAALGIYKNMNSAKIDIASLAKQAQQAALAIAGMKNGEVSGSTGIQGGSGGGGNYAGYSMNLTAGTFNGTNYTYTPNTISLDQFVSDLQIDISSYQNAIAQIDGQIAALQALLNSSLEDFKPSSGSGSGGSGGGSGSGSSGSGSDSGKDEVDNWFERQYKLHNHLINMDAEQVEDYLVWLNDAYKRAYEEGLITLYDFYQYQEEVYDKLRELFKDYLNDTEHEISMRSHFEYESAAIIKLYQEMIEKIEKELEAARAQGLDDNNEYVQYLQQQWFTYSDAIKEIEDEISGNAKSALDELIEIRIKMIKQDLENEKDAIKKKLDYLKDFYDKQKDMLKEVYDEEKYLEEQSEKRKTVADIQAELAQLEYDNSAWAQKRKLELAEAQKDLDDFERDHALEVAQDKLDALYEKQEDGLNAEIDLLDEKLNDAKAVYEQALEDIKNGSVDLYKQMIEWNATYGDGIDQTITDAWEAAYEALDKYYALYGEYYDGFTLDNATGHQRPDGGWDNSPINPGNNSGGGESGGGSGGSGGNSSGTGSGYEGSSSTPTVTDAVKRKVAAAIWNGGYGWGTGSDRSKKLTEVFGANNGIQALVNQNVGRYDASPGKEYTYLNMRKAYKGYWMGTRNAVSGMHAVDELGPEYVITSSDGTRYRVFSGGEKVLNAKATDFLYKFANNGKEILGKFTNGLFDGGSVGKIQPIVNNNEINMGNIIVRGNADKSTVSEIRRAQRESVENMLREFNRLNK